MLLLDSVTAAPPDGRCFVFASVNEGFGLPVLEAMRRGVPVACSHTSSLPEVAGDAAEYFDPSDVTDMARALSKLLEARTQLSNLMSYMDGRTGAEELITRVLNDPALMKSLAAQGKTTDAAEG